MTIIAKFTELAKELVGSSLTFNEEVVEEIDEWLKATRENLHKEFTDNG